MALVEQAIDRTRAAGLTELLIDLTGLSGFLTPSLSERFASAERWAQASAMSVRLALVAPATWLDPERFGVVVLANRGVTATAVETEAEALAWFDSFRGAPR